MKKSKELRINLNVKEDLVGWTPFHLACVYGQQHIVSMMTKNATDFNFDLRSKDKEGRTGFQIQHWGLRVTQPANFTPEHFCFDYK